MQSPLGCGQVAFLHGDPTDPDPFHHVALASARTSALFPSSRWTEKEINSSSEKVFMGQV